MASIGLAPGTVLEDLEDLGLPGADDGYDLEDWT